MSERIPTAEDAVAETEDAASRVVNLRIISPESVLFHGPVLWVQAPLYDGLIGIWPGHAPLIASLAKGHVRFATRQGEQELAVESGILRVRPTECTILSGSLMQEQDMGDKKALFEELEDSLIESLSGEETEKVQQQ